MQQLVSNLIESGDFERHVKRMRNIYGERRAALMSALDKHLGKRAHVSGDGGGVHLLLNLESELSTQDIVRAASKAGVGSIDTTKYYFDGAPQREFVVGYGGLTPAAIEEAIRRLAKVV